MLKLIKSQKVLLKEEQGISLLEVLASIGILGLFLSLVTSSFMTNLHSNMKTQIRYEAIQAAQSVLDDIRFQEVSSLVDEQTPRSLDIGNRNYQVQVTYCSNPSFCPSPEIKHVAVGVTYKSEVVYETDTIFTEL